MRFPHWIKTVASALLLTASAGPVLAQDGGQLPMFQPAYGTNDPGVLYPQGVPNGYEPYPAISPYQMGNIGWDQTYQGEDGLWMRRMLWQDREWFGSLDATYNRIKNPGDRHLGSDYIPYDNITNGPQGWVIPTYGQGATPGTGTGNNQNTGTGSTLPVSHVFIDKRVWPYPYLTPSGGTATTFPRNNLFPIRSLDAFGDTKGYGMQGQFGFFNEDGSGWSVGTFWTGPWQQNFTMGQDKINGIPITQTMILSLDGTLLYTRNGAVPLDWGFQDTSGTSGTATNLGTAKYDLLFHYDVKSQVLGSDTNFYLTPMVQREAFKLRPLIGARYLNISEQFHFRGIDSGFGYNLANSSATTGGNGGGGGNGTTTGVTYRPDANTLQINYDMYEALMTNNVRSNLAGPQIGLRYDFGDGDEFKVWGQSIVGLMANREDFRMWGNNIGDQSGLLEFSSGIDMLANDARFSSSRTINHVSPLFEQTFMAEAQILDMIPIVRNMSFLENTVFRCGYSITFVGNVAQAGESIDWKGYPLESSIHPHRDLWFTSRWNFGLEKRF